MFVELNRAGLKDEFAEQIRGEGASRQVQPGCRLCSELEHDLARRLAADRPGQEAGVRRAHASYPEAGFYPSSFIPPARKEVSDGLEDGGGMI